MDFCSHDTLLARLHMEALLPVIRFFIEETPEGKAVTESWQDWHWEMRWHVMGIGKTTLLFDRATVGVACQPRRLHLLFLSPFQLNSIFLKKGFSLPLPLSGFSLLFSHLPRFQSLADQFEKIMRGNRHENAPLRCLLAIKTAILSAAVLAECEQESHDLISGCTPGLALFKLGQTNLGWIRWDGRHATGGLDTLPEPPTVTVSFTSTALLQAALDGQLDQLAAVGLCDIQVCGLAPLADVLGLIMDRANKYLQP